MNAQRVSLLIRRGVLFAGIVVAVILGISTVFRSGPHQLGTVSWGSPHHRTDFTVYTTAAQAVLDGTDLYKARNSRGWNYIYPPPFAIAMVPLAMLSTFWASLVFYLISITVVVWAAWLAAKMASETWHPSQDPFWLSVLCLFLLTAVLLSGLARGQATPVVMWAAIAGMYCQWRGRDWLGGMCLAAAILVKVFPALLLVYYAWRGRWRFVGATLLATAVGAFILPAAVFGWQKNLHYLGEWTATVIAPALTDESQREDAELYSQALSSALVRNQSLPAVLERISGSRYAQQGAALLGLVMAGVMAWTGRRTRSRDELFVLSATVTWALLISPIAWTHYFVILLVPLAVMAAAAMAEENKTIRRILVVGLAMFALFQILIGTRILEPETNLQCASVVCLWVALVAVLAFRRRLLPLAQIAGQPIASTPSPSLPVP